MLRRGCQFILILCFSIFVLQETGNYRRSSQAFEMDLRLQSNGTKLVGSVSGSMAGGAAGSAAGVFLCVSILGVTTGPGAFACAVIGGGAVGFGGGTVAGWIGEYIGQTLFDYIQS